MMPASSLPAPLVAAEVDLRDFQYMPLDVVRLRDSDLAALEDPAACWASVLLWCAAWHQVPAASLPDDDRVLSSLAGFGRVVREWQKVRGGALRGWIRCSDGRLYHPVVSEKAREAWLQKQTQRWRTECARIKKHNQRHNLEGENSVPFPDLEDWMSQGCPQGQTLPVPGTQTHRPQTVPRETTSKGTEGNGTEGNGTDLKEYTTPDGVVRPRPSSDGPAQLGLDGSESPAGSGPYRPPECPHLDILTLWAEVLPAMPRHKPAQWKGARADHLRARWRERAAEKRWTTVDDGLADMRGLFEHVGESRFLTGRTQARDGRGPFLVTLEWLVNPTNWAKVVEGNYHRDVTP